MIDLLFTHWKEILSVLSFIGVGKLFVDSRIKKANIKKDITIIDNTLPLIEEIRDMWYEVDAKIKSGK